MKNTMIIVLFLFLSACGAKDNIQPQEISTDEIIMLGDSFINNGGWSEVWPDRQVYNEGVSGETTQEILARVPSLIAGHDPCHVFMIAGINNFGQYQSITETYESYLEIVDLLTSAGFQVSIITTCYLANLGEYYDEINRKVWWLNQLMAVACDDRGLVQLDLVSLVCDTGYLKTDYDSGDGVHLNQEGYDLFYGLVG